MIRRFLIILALLLPGTLSASTHFVDNCVVIGNDSNNGTDPTTPWLTAAKVNVTSLLPSDSVLFRRGCIWRETFAAPSSGVAGAPITFGAYGTGVDPEMRSSDIAGAGVAGNWTNTSGNIWTTTFIVQDQSSFPNNAPMFVWFNGTYGTLAASAVAISGANQWFWAANVLSVFSVGNPASTYTSPGIEGVSRTTGWYSNSQSYLIFTNIQSNFSHLGILLHFAANNSILNYSSTEVGTAIDINDSHTTVSNVTISHTHFATGTSDGGGIAIEPGTAPSGPSFVTVNGVNSITFADAYCVSGTSVTDHSNVSGVTCDHFAQMAAITGLVGFSGSGTSDSYHDNIATNGANTGHGFTFFGANGSHFRNRSSNNAGAGFWVQGNNTMLSYSLANANSSTIHAGFYVPAGSGVKIYNVTAYANFVNFRINAPSVQPALRNSISSTSTSTEFLFLNSTDTTSDYNVSFRLAGGTPWRWGATNYNWANYLINSGQDVHSINSDPDFVSTGAGNFTLQASSPAIGKGLAVGLQTDLRGHYVYPLVTIGAYQFGTPVNALHF